MTSIKELIEFRITLQAEMSELGMRNVSDVCVSRWTTDSGIEVIVYEDFALIKVWVPEFSRAEPDFVYDNAFKRVSHIPFIESNNHMAFVSGAWVADFAVDFRGCPRRLAHEILQISEVGVSHG